ncbi:MAG: 2,3-bisphosphoglycerate-independent phosphoglycerate mutase [bacterium]
MLPTKPKPVVLVVVDGYGMAPPSRGNAITNAKTPTMDKLWKTYTHGYLYASGSHVGLPHGIMGNSEVGHVNIGAGYVVFQYLPRINNSIINQSFYNNKAFENAVEHISKTNGNLHLIGLVSTGEVHASLEHLFSLLKFAQMHKLKDRVFIHCITDGRDSGVNDFRNYLIQIQEECKRRGVGKIASIVGRYYAMDRNDKWDRTKMAYDLFTQGSQVTFDDPKKAIEAAYAKGETDEFITPISIVKGDNKIVVKDNDSVIFFNFREDRATQISKAFAQSEFMEFERAVVPQNIHFVTMTMYDKSINADVAFLPENVVSPLGKVIEEAGLTQLRLAETEKYAHVTYFFDGGKRVLFKGEDRQIISSPKVATYDMMPEMSSYKITDFMIDRLNMNIYDFILMNFANPDMVGHTGNLDAAIKAVEVIDECMDRIYKKVLEMGGALIITGDHGNCEVMIDLQTGMPNTEHTTNPVPFIYVSKDAKPVELQFGRLADIAPTICNLMKLQVPQNMTGRNLLAGI